MTNVVFDRIIMYQDSFFFVLSFMKAASENVRAQIIKPKVDKYKKKRKRLILSNL